MRTENYVKLEYLKELCIYIRILLADLVSYHHCNVYNSAAYYTGHSFVYTVCHCKKKDACVGSAVLL